MGARHSSQGDPDDGKVANRRNLVSPDPRTGPGALPKKNSKLGSWYDGDGRGRSLLRTRGRSPALIAHPLPTGGGASNEATGSRNLGRGLDSESSPSTLAVNSHGVKLFLSYGRGESTEFTRWLSTRLTENGFQCWMDEIDIPSASMWQSKIAEGIVSCDALVAVLNKKYVDSIYCCNELVSATPLLCGVLTN